MFTVGLLSWWYGRGWVAQWRRMRDRFLSTLEFFSIGQLASTLFSPFRQIAAGTSGDTSLGGIFRGLVDQLISRVIGGIVRFFTIVMGLVVITLLALYEILILVCWWVVPVLPVAGLILFAVGWVPTWI